MKDFDDLPQESKDLYFEIYDFCSTELNQIIAAIHSAGVLEDDEHEEAMDELEAGELRLATERVESWVDELQLEQNHSFRFRLARVNERLDEKIPGWELLG